MRPFTPTWGPHKGRNMLSCGGFVGFESTPSGQQVPAKGANRKGYCEYMEPADAPAPPAAASGPASGANSSPMSPRLTAASWALQAASRHGGPVKEVLARAATYYNWLHQIATTGSVPEPQLQPQQEESEFS